jgi:hypothetical protein
MEFLQKLILGMIPTLPIIIGIKTSLGHPINAFEVMIVSLWCSLILVGIVNIIEFIIEIRSNKEQIDV